MTHEDLIESWINGNRSFVFRQYEEMNAGEKEDFINFLTSSPIAEPYQTDIMQSFLKRLA
jgi:hypothetical protein